MVFQRSKDGELASCGFMYTDFTEALMDKEFRGRLVHLWRNFQVVAVYLYEEGYEGNKAGVIEVAVTFALGSPFGKDIESLRARLGLLIKDTACRLVALSEVPIFEQYRIVTTGHVNYVGDQNHRTDVEDRVYRDYLDFASFLEPFSREEI